MTTHSRGLEPLAPEDPSGRLSFCDSGSFVAPSAPETIPVAWEGSVFVHHSLSKINRELGVRLVADRGLDLAVIPYEPDGFDGRADPRWRPLADRVGVRLRGSARVHVRHQWPPNWTPPPSGAWVLLQPWEFGPVPASWVKPLASVDEIWVPSSFVREGYVQSGVDPDKIVVIPNGVDVDRFRPEGDVFPLPRPATCQFLFVGGTIRRKGIDVLLRAWQKAFRASDGVRLVIKGNPCGFVYTASDISGAVHELNADPRCAEVAYLPIELDEGEMAALYRACDVFVLPYRGEGFGMPIAEAMACGLPAITTAAGASRDFCRSGNALLLPSRRITFATVQGERAAAGSFFLEDPDEDALACALRLMAFTPELRARIGAAGRARIAAEFTWDAMARRVRERIEVLAGRTPVRTNPCASAGARRGAA